MVTTNQIHPGMTLSIRGKLYRVESCVKVTVPKGSPFIKTKLKDLSSDEVLEKNFKLDQAIKDVSLIERNLEFLYQEGKDYLFLDVDTLDKVPVPIEVIGERIQFIKEGIEIKASFYGDTVFSVELPQFLELMVASTEGGNEKVSVSDTAKTAILETGAKIQAPPYIEAGDVVKVDTRSWEFIQRV